MGRKALPIAPYLDKLEQALAIGATFELAARYAGISPRTFTRWRSQAEQAKPGTALAELRDRLTQAEARAAIGWLVHIEQAARAGDWRAAAFMLERRYPEAFGRRVQADVRLQAHQIAEEIAQEIGIPAADIIREAEGFLKEYDLRHRR